MKKKLIASILVIMGSFIATSAISQNIKLNPIKPGVKSSSNISDEQQAILAVRKAKASVVSIVGYDTQPSRANPNSINGTGFIFRSDGLIVSNNHVVQQKDTDYYVAFADGTRYLAKVLGVDKFSDVALLKIEANNLPAAALGNSDELETGQSVFAIGNSLGRYQNTVTRGVISGLGRAVGLDDTTSPTPRFQNLIQTDASINPGNSGGPLVNLAGEVIGMNTMVDRTGEAVGFSIPVNTIKNSVNQLLTLGKASHAYVGLSFLTINKAVKISKGLSVEQGAWLDGVVKDSPANFAGLLPGDIITEINGQKLDEKNELDIVVQKYPAGTTVLFTFLRDGKIIQTPVLLGEYK